MTMALIGPENVDDKVVERCSQLYTDVLKKVYQQTRPKADQDKILSDDTWRYALLHADANSAQSLSKAQVARLVQWKM